MTSAARNEECPNGLSNTSPFIPILGIIRLTGASPFSANFALLHLFSPCPFSLNLRLIINFEFGK